MQKLIVIMLDGISADAFARHQGHMPHLASLAKRGLVVQRLAAEVCGTSFPGRTSIVTGVPAAQSGVYGNLIWDGSQFRHAHPDDVRTPTLPALAQVDGRSTAAIGYGMVRPEDAEVFRAPWWAGVFIQRSRDAVPAPSSPGWLRAVEHHDPRIRGYAESLGLDLPQLPSLSDRILRSAVGDAQIMSLAGTVALAHQPDLLLTEVLLPDTAQHYAGYDSPEALWSFGYADALVGQMLQRLEEASLMEQYAVAVLSDHGHSPIEQALFPEAIIPGSTFACEGSMLHVVPRTSAELAEVRARLSEFGVEEYPNEHIPEEWRGQVVCFAAPERFSFEFDPARPADAPQGEPSLRSSHGLRPGMPGDDRFLLLAGSGIPSLKVDRAEARQVAPTLAAVLGLQARPSWAEGLI